MTPSVRLFVLFNHRTDLDQIWMDRSLRPRSFNLVLKYTLSVWLQVALVLSSSSNAHRFLLLSPSSFWLPSPFCGLDSQQPPDAHNHPTMITSESIIIWLKKESLSPSTLLRAYLGIYKLINVIRKSFLTVYNLFVHYITNLTIRCGFRGHARRLSEIHVTSFWGYRSVFPRLTATSFRMY